MDIEEEEEDFDIVTTPRRPRWRTMRRPRRDGIIVTTTIEFDIRSSIRPPPHEIIRPYRITTRESPIRTPAS
jgi:hypothetical protein